ncbi:ABC transporter ATP-binding protein [Candidatus Njordibacter sp. Uisw_058]|uniref:ABC transporter ATP-binding protein n=1 Tax=Candidatus Njordibacter sp. Uisw_058 TaxID=3230974 RepID=UPI003D494E5A
MLIVDGLRKVYKLYDRPSDRLKSFLLRKHYYRQYTAIESVSFELKPGESLGILGQNGAGKSTLLKMLAGVLLPDQGSISIDGNITGLLELGTGFDNNLTGYDNVLINGLLIGMSQQEVEAKRQAIIDFSELHDFISEPMRTYSSGMVMRLAFAIAIHADPQCFLVDEALSVGDGYFQQKCIKKIRQYRDSGGALVFVSHDLNAVKMVCDRVIVLDQGQVVADCDPEQGVNIYNRLLARESQQDQSSTVNRVGSQSSQNYGSNLAEFMSIDVAGETSETDVVSSGEKLNIKLHIKANTNLPDITVGIMLRDRFGQDIFGTNTHLKGHSMSLKDGQEITVNYAVMAAIATGKYTITVALHSAENHLMDCFHWCDRIATFEVAGSHGAPFSGVCDLPTEITIGQHLQGDVAS